MRLLLVLLSACVHAPAPAPAAETAPAPAAPAALAPRLFDAAALRDGFLLGTRLRLRIEQAGQLAVEERWEVTAHDDQGCTIASKAYDPATGELLRDEGEGPATWTELEGHASFPAAATEIADDVITVPAGTFETRRYTVHQEDGAVAVFHFAKTLPGPPVSMVVTRDGTLVRSMVLLERTP